VGAAFFLKLRHGNLPIRHVTPGEIPRSAPIGQRRRPWAPLPF
jgi:hypothetical protein